MTLKRIPLPSSGAVVVIFLATIAILMAAIITNQPMPSPIDTCISIIQKGEKDRARLAEVVGEPSFDDALKGAK